MSYWHLASNKPILISPAERSIFWNVFLCWLHNLIEEAHKFHSKPFSLTESHPTFFFLKKHSFVSLSTNLVLFCHRNLSISFFPALSTMSNMSYDMQLFWHRSFSWGGKPRVFGVFIRYDSLGLFVWEVNNGGNYTGQGLRFLPRHVLEQNVFQIL